MTGINNLTELRSEISRLRQVARDQELQLKKDVTDIGESLKPQNILLSTISSLFGITLDKKEFLKDGIAYSISLLLQRFILKTEKKMEHKIYEWVDTLFVRIKDFMNRHSDPSARRREREEDQQV